MTNVGIYKITSPTGKVYIGQSINIKDRFRHYREINGAVVKQRKLYASLLKYGCKAHSFEIIHDLPKDVGREILNTYETLYMEQFIACGVELLNIKEGGLNGRHSEETKQKQRLNGKLGKPVSEETRAKMRIARATQVRPKGIKFSEEAKARMRGIQRRKPVITEERKAQMRIAVKKAHEALRGKSSHMKGKKHSPESILKMKESLKGRVGCRSKKVIDTISGVIYKSAKEAALSIGINHSTLIARLNGANKNKSSLKYL